MVVKARGFRHAAEAVGMPNSTVSRRISALPEKIVAEDVAQGRLRRILPDWEGPPTPIYAMTETRLLPAKTQRFIEFLHEHLGQKI